MYKQINLSENKNPLAPSKTALEGLRSLGKKISNYPDYKNIEINKSVADFFNVPNDKITITNGSMEAISLLIRSLKCGETVATIYTPTFWGYENLLEKENLKVNFVELEGHMSYSLKNIKRDASVSNIMFLCNPNNPTLSEINKEDLESIIIEKCNCHFIIDETMLLFDEQYEKKTVSDLVVKYQNLSVICSLSKFFGVAGLRAGVVISNGHIIKNVKEILIPYGIDIIKQILIPQIVQDQNFVLESRKYISNAREIFVNDLRKLEGCKVINSNTNFILMKIKGVSAETITSELKLKGIIVRNISEAYNSINGEWVRISIGRKIDNTRVITELKQYEKERLK